MKNFAKLAFCLLTFSSQVSYGMDEIIQENDSHKFYISKDSIKNKTVENILPLNKKQIETIEIFVPDGVGQGILNALQKYTFSQVTKLNLTSSQIAEITQEHLKSFPKIQTLNLTHNDIGTDSFKLSNFKCETLRSLILINNGQLSNYSREENPHLMQTLKESFPYITELSIGHNKMGNKLIKDIVNSKLFDLLEVLSVFGNKISDIDPLLDTSFPHLEKLDLGSNDLYNSGIDSLAECKFPKLKELLLYETKISGKGLMLLSQAEGWGKLKKLHLGWNDIDANDVEDFLNTPFAKSIKYLDLRATKVSEEQKENIRKKFDLKEAK